MRRKDFAFFCFGLLVGVGSAAAIAFPKQTLAQQESCSQLSAQNQALKKVLGSSADTIKYLEAKLKDAQNTGTQGPGLPGSVTVIYEKTNRQVDVNLSLKFRGIPLANFPTFKIGAEGQLVPRWVFKGIVQPYVSGDDGGSLYYFSSEGQWYGPYPALDVSQLQ